MGSSISLGEMWVKYKADITDLSEKMGKAKSEMKSANDAAKESGGGIFSSFKNAGEGFLDFASKAGMAVMGVETLASTAVSLGQSLLQPAESAETMTTAFTTLLGSTQAANQEMQTLDQFAAKTNFQTMDVDSFASKLIAMKTSVGDVIPEVTAFGDELGAIGRGSAANMQSVINVVGKIRTEGQLTIGTMSELSMNGIDAWDALGRATGKSKDELTSMIQQGLFPADDAMKALTSGIESNPLYTGGMAKQSATMTGLISTMQSNWDQAMVSFTSPVLKNLEPEIAGIGNTMASPEFKQFAQTVGQDIVTALGNASQFFSAPAFKQFADLVGGQLATGVKDLASYLDSPSFAQFAKIAGQDIANALLTTTQDVENIVSWFIQWHDPLVAVGVVLTAAFIPAIIQSGVESVIAGSKMAVAYVKNIINTGVEGWKAAIHIGEWIVGVIASGVQATIAGVKIAADFVGGLIASGVQAGIAGVKIGVEFVGNLIKVGIQAGLTAIKFTASLVPAIIGFIVQSAIAAATAIPSMLAGFGAWVISAGSAALATLAVIWPILLVIGVIALIVVAIMHWSDIVKFFQGVWTVTWNAISGFFIGVWNGVMGFMGTIPGFFAGIGQGMWDGIKSGINWIIDGIDSFIKYFNGLHIGLPAVNQGPIQLPAFSVGVPQIPLIPRLASGGAVAPGQWFVAGDPGPNSELIYGGSSGATVYSHAQSSTLIMTAVLAALAQAQQQQPVIHVHVASPDLYVDGERMTDALGPHIGNKVRLEGGLRAR